MSVAGFARIPHSFNRPNHLCPRRFVKKFGYNLEFASQSALLKSTAGSGPNAIGPDFVEAGCLLQIR